LPAHNLTSPENPAITLLYGKADNGRFSDLGSARLGFQGLGPVKSLARHLPRTTMSARIVPSQLDIKHINSSSAMQTLAQRRGRSNSLLKVEEVAKDMLEDQSAYANINVEWVNRKGNPRMPLN
jgi:hypothetical protein